MRSKFCRGNKVVPFEWRSPTVVHNEMHVHHLGTFQGQIVAPSRGPL
jgi:hypothetical protein